MRISMNPPPPIFPAAGCTTASANPVATAASTALPPACMISTPARDASSCTLTTIECWACTGWVEARAAADAKTATTAVSSQMNDFCGDRMQVEGIRNCNRTLEASRAKEAESNPEARAGTLGRTQHLRSATCDGHPMGERLRRGINQRMRSQPCFGLIHFSEY